MSTSNEVKSIYEELIGILVSLEDASSWFDDNGFSQRANEVIRRTAMVCPEIKNIESYLIKPGYSDQRGEIIYTTPTKANLNSLLGRIRGFYELEELHTSNGHTFIQNQTQNQSQSIALEIQERIISEIPKYTEGSKERTFLEKLKASLPTIRGATDILSSVLKIGPELGLDIATIRKLLGL